MIKGFLDNVLSIYRDDSGYVEHEVGIDYLRIIIKDDNLEGLDEIIKSFEILDYDNSNTRNIHFTDRKISIFRLRSKNGSSLLATTTYEDITLPIFFVERYDENTRAMTKSYGRIDLYGMFYRLKKIHGDKKHEGGYLEFIDKICGNRRISRIDWKIDFFIKKKGAKMINPGDVTKLRKNSKVEYKVIGGKVQSWRLGDRKNKRYIIRAYDKLADTLVKGKFQMYKDYFKYGSVHRLEFEFLNHFCRDYTYNNIDNLLDTISRFLGYDKSIGPIFESKNDCDIGEVKDRFKYADTTKGYIKGCVNAGINIFGLIDEVFKSCGKTQEEVWDMYIDYFSRIKGLENFTDKKEDIELINSVYNIFGYRGKK